MTFDVHRATGNQLLDALTLQALTTLALDMDWAEHSLRDRLNVPGQPMEYAYFPVSGLISVITLHNCDDQVEAGMVGNEGFIGEFTLLQADHTPNLLICQAAGRSLRMPKVQFLAAVAAMPEFLSVLLRYVHVFAVQLSSTILANSSYLLQERLARWILMVQDRVDSNHLQMTHELMSLMLGVRRPGVTETIHDLEGRHLIRSTRGQLEVTNREGLELLAGGCYGQAEREHKRLITSAPRN
jgi:CRP-like cAMP-binding protein